MKGKINAIFGSTASGKTAYAIKLAHQIDGVVINYDSMQIYKEIPILSAQPTMEEKEGVDHRLYGYLSVYDHSSAAAWKNLAIQEIRNVRALGKTPILVGGTGMYLKTLVTGIDDIPDVPLKITRELNQQSTSDLYTQLVSLDPTTLLTPNDRQRIIRALGVVKYTGKPIFSFHKQAPNIAFNRADYHIMWLKRERSTVYENINKRFVMMLENGAIDEARALASNRHQLLHLPKAHGLRELIMYTFGDITLQDVIISTTQQTRNYAKRQFTWANHQIDCDEVV